MLNIKLLQLLKLYITYSQMDSETVTLFFLSL